MATAKAAVEIVFRREAKAIYTLTEIAKGYSADKIVRGLNRGDYAVCTDGIYHGRVKVANAVSRNAIDYFSGEWSRN